MTAERSNRGSALLVAVMLSLVAGALVVSVLLASSAEVTVAANHRTGHVLAYIADAALHRAIGELAGVAWAPLPGGNQNASYHQAVGTILDSGLSPANLTAAVQRASDARYTAGPDRPVWRVFAQAPAYSILALDPRISTSFTITWLADDSEEQDGRPEADSNGVLLVRTDALGLQTGRRSVEAVIRREEPGGASAVRVLSWRPEG